MVRGVNEAAVVEMFKGYYKDFRELLHIIEDNNNITDIKVRDYI